MTDNLYCQVPAKDDTQNAKTSNPWPRVLFTRASRASSNPEHMGVLLDVQIKK